MFRHFPKRFPGLEKTFSKSTTCRNPDHLSRTSQVQQVVRVSKTLSHDSSHGKLNHLWQSLFAPSKEICDISFINVSYKVFICFWMKFPTAMERILHLTLLLSGQCYSLSVAGGFWLFSLNNWNIQDLLFAPYALHVTLTVNHSSPPLSISNRAVFSDLMCSRGQIPLSHEQKNLERRAELLQRELLWPGHHLRHEREQSSE